MEIVERQIADLIEAEYNPRELTEKQFKQLRDSLKRFGMVDPVIVNKHPEREDIIVGGHQRCRVWRDLGNNAVPTVEVSLTPDKEKELNVRLNKNTGQFDMDMLANHFDTTELIEWGFEDWQLSISEDIDLDEFFEEKQEEAPPKNKIILEYSEEDFNTINAKFNELDGSKEQIVWKLLGL